MTRMNMMNADHDKYLEIKRYYSPLNGQLFSPRKARKARNLCTFFVPFVLFVDGALHQLNHNYQRHQRSIFLFLTAA